MLISYTQEGHLTSISESNAIAALDINNINVFVFNKIPFINQTTGELNFIDKAADDLSGYAGRASNINFSILFRALTDFMNSAGNDIYAYWGVGADQEKTRADIISATGLPGQRVINHFNVVKLVRVEREDEDFRITLDVFDTVDRVFTPRCIMVVRSLTPDVFPVESVSSTCVLYAETLYDTRINQSTVSATAGSNILDFSISLDIKNSDYDTSIPSSVSNLSLFNSTTPKLKYFRIFGEDLSSTINSHTTGTGAEHYPDVELTKDLIVNDGNSLLATSLTAQEKVGLYNISLPSTFSKSIPRLGGDIIDVSYSANINLGYAASPSFYNDLKIYPSPVSGRLLGPGSFMRGVKQHRNLKNIVSYSESQDSPSSIINQQPVWQFPSDGLTPFKMFAGGFSDPLTFGANNTLDNYLNISWENHLHSSFFTGARPTMLNVLGTYFPELEINTGPILGYYSRINVKSSFYITPLVLFNDVSNVERDVSDFYGPIGAEANFNQSIPLETFFAQPANNALAIEDNVVNDNLTGKRFYTAVDKLLFTNNQYNRGGYSDDSVNRFPKDKINNLILEIRMISSAGAFPNFLSNHDRTGISGINGNNLGGVVVYRRKLSDIEKVDSKYKIDIDYTTEPEDARKCFYEDTAATIIPHRTSGVDRYNFIFLLYSPTSNFMYTLRYRSRRADVAWRDPAKVESEFTGRPFLPDINYINYPKLLINSDINFEYENLRQTDDGFMPPRGYTRIGESAEIKNTYLNLNIL